MRMVLWNGHVEGRVENVSTIREHPFPLMMQTKLAQLSALLPLPLAHTIDFVLRLPVLLTLSEERLSDSYKGLKAVLLQKHTAVVNSTATLTAASVVAGTGGGWGAARPVAAAAAVLEAASAWPGVTGWQTPSFGLQSIASLERDSGDGSKMDSDNWNGAAVWFPVESPSLLTSPLPPGGGEPLTSWPGALVQPKRRPVSASGPCRLSQAARACPELLLIAPAKVAEQVGMPEAVAWRAHVLH